MRLDRFVAQCTPYSRAEVRRLVMAGRIKVDGARVAKSQLQVPETARVTLDGALLEPPRHRYLMLNKPQGVICATRDSQHPTVIDLLPGASKSGGLGQLHPAGRLDIDTTGLVLITDDGDWSHQLTSPRKQCGKRYRVILAEPLPGSAQQRLAEGLLLKGESRPTRPARLWMEDPTHLSIEIHEGRYHQVKRMFAALGNRVVGLHRDRIGSLDLDPTLKPGQWRPLEADEIALFRRES